MSLANLLEWWNIIFALPLAVGLFLMAVVALSGLADIALEHGADSHDSIGDAHGDAPHDMGDVRTQRRLLRWEMLPMRRRTMKWARCPMPKAATPRRGKHTAMKVHILTQ